MRSSWRLQSVASRGTPANHLLKCLADHVAAPIQDSAFGFIATAFSLLFLAAFIAAGSCAIIRCLLLFEGHFISNTQNRTGFSVFPVLPLLPTASDFSLFRCYSVSFDSVFTIGR